MADSDKDIMITPNISQTSQPEIKLVGKDNSPMYLKVLDDNTLSFEGTEGQVFSIGPTMSSGDIFSVNDISGIQSIAVNADGTITIDAQTKSTTIKNNASATSTLILENTNADAVDGPILEFYRNTPSPADGDDTGAIVWTMQTDAGNKHEYGRIVMEYNDASDNDERGELIFKLTEDSANEQEYMRLRGGSRQIEFNAPSDDIDFCYNSDATADFFYINAATERIGIGDAGTAPSHLVHIEATGANGELFLERTSGAGILLQAQSATGKIGTNTNHDLSFMTNGSTRMHIENAGKVGIGTTSPTGKLTVTDAGHDMIHLNRTVDNAGWGAGIIGRLGNSASTTAAHEYAGIFFQIETNTDGSEAGSIAFNTSSGGVAADDSATHAMQITGAGKVGIGTTSPDDILHVKGTDAALLVEDAGSNSNPAVEIKNDAVHWKLQARGDSSDNFRIVEGSSTHVVVDTSGNLLASTGTIRSGHRNSFNTMTAYYFDRQHVGTNAWHLRVPVGGSSTENPASYFMPRAGSIMQVLLGFYGQALATSGTDTWTLYAREPNDTLHDCDFDVNFANLVRIGTQNNYSILCDVSALSDAISFPANSTLSIKRTDGSPIDVENVTAQVWVTFDA